MSKSQEPDRFLQPVTTNEPFFLNTSVYSFDTDVESLLSSVDDYVISMRAAGSEVEILFSIRIENVTAPRPGAGSWVQAKQHFDGRLADGDYAEKEDLRSRLGEARANMVTAAGY